MTESLWFFQSLLLILLLFISRLNHLCYRRRAQNTISEYLSVIEDWKKITQQWQDAAEKWEHIAEGWKAEAMKERAR